MAKKLTKMRYRKKAKRRADARPIRGWDWTELLSVWGLQDTFKNQCEHDQAEMIRLKLRPLHDAVAYDEPATLSAAKEIKACRYFMARLGKNSRHYGGNVFVEIAKIKHDATFLSWLDHLLEWCWS